MNSLRTRITAALRAFLHAPGQAKENADHLKILAGQQLASSAAAKTQYGSLSELEFKVFSQFGDDGIIQYLVHKLNLRHQTFVEFGVGDYSESNTRFLLQKDNWSGFVMDGSEQCIQALKNAPYFWRQDLRAKAVFITRDNIRQLLSEAVAEWAELDLLHIDLDGNDYWIWKEIDLKPPLVIVEYNSTFGIDRAITIPYSDSFCRTKAHYSNLYWGSSLRALHTLAIEKGYQFVGCNSAGNNAYFVRDDVMNENVIGVTLENGYVNAKYRESRDQRGTLTYAGVNERARIIRGLQVFDIEQNKIVPF